MSTDEVFTQDGRLVESVQHHGDGTGTRTVYDADGNVAEVEDLTGLPIPETPAPTAAQLYATFAAEAAAAQTMQEQREAAQRLADALAALEIP